MIRCFASTSVLLALVLSLLGLSACAITPGHVHIAYVPANSREVTKVVGAELVTVRVDVFDECSSKDAVGHKINVEGAEMAPIIADNDIPQTLRTAIESELARRGFRIGATGATVIVTLSRFENCFKAGFWSATPIAKVKMNVVVKNYTDSIVFAKLIDAEGVNPGVQITPSDSTQIALNRGLQAALSNLFTASAFLASLEYSSKATTIRSALASPPPGSTVVQTMQRSRRTRRRR